MQEVVPITPTFVQVVEQPTPETNVADILIGAVGLVGFVLVLAAVVGVIAGALFIAYRKLRPASAFHDQGPQAALNLSTLDAHPPDGGVVGR